MTTVAAGIDVSKKSLNIHINGRDGTATNGTDGLRRAARLPGTARRGAGRHGGHGADAPGPPAVAAKPGFPDRRGEPPPVPGPPQARRCALPII